jgi:hypothetical protein
MGVRCGIPRFVSWDRIQPLVQLADSLPMDQTYRANTSVAGDHIPHSKSAMAADGFQCPTLMDVLRANSI